MNVAIEGITGTTYTELVHGSLENNAMGDRNDIMCLSLHTTHTCKYYDKELAIR